MTSAARARSPAPAAGPGGEGTTVFDGEAWVVDRPRSVECRRDRQAYRLRIGGVGSFWVAADGRALGGPLAALALLAGFQIRLAAWALALFTIASAFLFHANFADQIQSIMFLKNWAIAGGLLMIAAHGAPAWSLDRRLGRQTA